MVDENAAIFKKAKLEHSFESIQNKEWDNPIKNELNTFLETYNVSNLIEFEFKNRNGSSKEYMLLPILLYAIILEVKKLNDSNSQNEKLDKLIDHFQFYRSIFSGNITSSSFYSYEYLWTICEKAEKYKYDVSFILGNVKRNPLLNQLNETRDCFSSSFVLHLLDQMEHVKEDEKYDFYLLLVQNELRQFQHQKAFDFAIQYLEKEDRLDAFLDIAISIINQNSIKQLDISILSIVQIEQEEQFLIKTINHLINLNELNDNASIYAELLFSKSQHHPFCKRCELNNLFFSFIIKKGDFKFLDFFENFQSISTEQYSDVIIKLNELNREDEAAIFFSKLNFLDTVYVYSHSLKEDITRNKAYENELLNCLNKVSDYDYFFNFTNYFQTTLWHRVSEECKIAFYKIAFKIFSKRENHLFENQLLFLNISILLNESEFVFKFLSQLKSSKREELIVELMKSTNQIDQVYVDFFIENVKSPKIIALFYGLLYCQSTIPENQLLFEKKLKNIKNSKNELNCLFQTVDYLKNKDLPIEINNYFINLYFQKTLEKVNSLTDYFYYDTYIKKAVNEFSDLIDPDKYAKFCTDIFISCWPKTEEVKLIQLTIDFALEAKKWSIVLDEFDKFDQIDKLLSFKKIGLIFLKNGQFELLTKIRPEICQKEVMYSLLVSLINEEISQKESTINREEIGLLNELVKKITIIDPEKIDENFIEFNITYHLLNDEIEKAKEKWIQLFNNLKDDFDFYSVKNVLRILFKYVKVLISKEEEIDFIHLINEIITKINGETMRRSLLIDFANAGYINEALTLVKLNSFQYDYTVLFGELVLIQEKLNPNNSKTEHWVEIDNRIETLKTEDKIETIAEFILLAYSNMNPNKAKEFEERLFFELFNIKENELFNTCLGIITFSLCSYSTKEHFLKLLPLYDEESKNLYYKELAFEITKVNYWEAIKYVDIIPNEFKERWLKGIFMGLQKKQISDVLFSELYKIVKDYPKLYDLFSILENNIKLLKKV